MLGLVTATAYGVGQLYQPRAAYIQVGAMLGTIMAANVLFVIIPGHWELIRAKEAGREPDPRPGLVAKQRSVHNSYLTLPVLFTMLAGHLSFTYTHDHAWAVLVALMVVGAAIRHYFIRPPRRGDALVDPGRLRLRDRGDRGLAPAARRRAPATGGPRRDVRAGAARSSRRAARRATRCSPTQPGFALAAGGRRPRHAGADPRARRADQGRRRRLDVHAARQRDEDDRRRSAPARAVDRSRVRRSSRDAAIPVAGYELDRPPRGGGSRRARSRSSGRCSRTSRS